MSQLGHDRKSLLFVQMNRSAFIIHKSKFFPMNMGGFCMLLPVLFPFLFVSAIIGGLGWGSGEGEGGKKFK